MMGLYKHLLLRSPLTTVSTINRCSILGYCTKPNLDENETKSKTITERFTESMQRAIEQQKLIKESKKPKKPANIYNYRGIQPKDGYKPRFEYNGYLKNSHWRYFDEETKLKLKNKDNIEPTEAEIKYRERKKRKFCLLLGFCGTNYYGMQYNITVNTIEDMLLGAMLKNEWILDEHKQKPHLLEFQHGSRTDRGVSAARMNCSLLLPTDVSINDLNRDLPSDIRLFGMKRVTRKFSARHHCSARTYSYTLPTIAFAPYNDQSELCEYRVTPDRLQRANEILSMFKGLTNFHNYTIKKLHFDRASSRRIEFIECTEPFIESDIEFVRIVVKGESFMYHQIRKMVGFSLAVIRGVVGDDMLARSLTEEEFHTPLAPGLGLMLERLHYTLYAQQFSGHDPLTFDEFDDDVEQFRREKIHPVIVESEIQENSMREWLELLCVHSFDRIGRQFEEQRRYGLDGECDDDWGEDPEFLKKLNEKLENLEK